MATLIGIVSKVIGQVFAVASDGTRRALVEGDKLFAGDQLSTGAEGAVAVHLQNGQELTLGRGSSMQMTPQLLANQIPHVDSSEAVTPSQAQLTDVEQLQKAIAAGDDPTQTAEATAAGPTTTAGVPGGIAGSGHSFVMLEEVGGRVDPIIGFPTAGFNGIPELPEERLNANPDNNAVAADTLVVPPVTPPVPNNPVTLDGLSVDNGELTVNEANLADGSASNPGALTQSGTFTVNAPDGLTSLSIGGINVISGGVAAGFPQSVTTPLGSTLTVTGYNPATGVVSYSYTLNGAETHASGEGGNTLGEHFAVVAGDSNGDSVTGSLDINIADDVPQAVDDSNGIASETLLTLNGNVLTNDVQGADRVPVGENSGPITPGTFTGTYGTLVLNANGTYTYTLNTSDADFKALHGGGDGTDSFTYTLTDADGDSSTATLVLQIHNNDDPDTIGGLNIGGGELTVFEKNLGDGSAPDATALTQNGTFTVTALDGVTSLTVGGIAVVTAGVAAGFPQSITTPLGSTLTITGFNAATGVVSYSYTLNDNEAHPTANGANTLPEQFAVTLVDDNGTTATGSLDVNIVDDLPQGVNDSNASTASETLLTLNGNVLSNDVQGADRVTIGEGTGPITPGTFTGTYGTLVLNANGTYTYTLNTSDADFKALHGGGDGTDTFTYTITDADGDSSTANLVLQIHNNDDPVTIGGLNVEGGELTVFEKNLGDGSAPDATALTQSGTFTVTALDGLQTLTVGGITVVSAGVTAGFPQTAVTPLGSTLTITGFNAATGVISYSYTLNDNEAHPTANGANTLPEQFTVTAVDDNGTTATGSLDVNIVDDLPQGVNDSNASTASETLLTLNGNVLSNDVQGADRVTIGEGTGPITPGTFTGTYGTLVLNANGTYTYTLNTSDTDFKALHGGGDGTDTFTYTITDADGDTSTANLVLQIHNNDDPVTIGGLNVEGGELTVFEKNLGDGSAPDATALTQNGTFTVTALDGVTTLTVGGIAVVTAGVAAGFPQSITTPLGSTLTITGFNAATGVVSYSYTLNDNEAHPTANGANTLPEQFAVTLVDDNGTTATGSLDVNIVDDLPQGVNDSNASTASETLLTLNGNVLSNDVQGADRVTIGEGTGPITPGTFTGTYGTLVLNANGTYTYTLNTSDADFKALHGGGDGTDTFTYTITDADGDSSTANLVLQIHNNDDPVTIGGLNVEGGELTVFEKNLGDGSAPDATSLTQNGTFTVTALDGVTSLTVGGIAVVTAGVAAGFPQSITTPLGSTLTITGFNAATGVVSYSYTLNDNEAHPTANGANTLPEQFAVTLVDDNGTTATGSLDVNIVDDLPKGVNDSNGTASETLLTLNGNVLSNDVQGADRVTIGEGTGPITPGTFTGTYGTLVLNANGTYTYTLNTSDADFKALHGGGDGTDTFTYTITDADGDSSTANLVLQIHNNDDPVTIGGLNVEGGELTVFEKNLGDGSAPDATALTQNGTFTVTALDGVTTLTVGGIAVVTAGVAAGFPQSITTPLGSTLTITGFNAATGVVSYSYTLNDNEAHPTANGANTLPEQFAVTAVDDNGTTATGSLDVNIVDDLPQGVNDSNASTASETLLTLNGNVLSNDVQGADRVTVGENAGPITPGTFTGTYGTLVLNANGTYTYTLNTSDADFKALHGGGDGTESFTYTLTDADGDSSTATLVLQIHNNDDPVTIGGLNVEGGELTVFEKNLSDGSAPDGTALTQNGTFTVTALDGVTTLTVGGIAVVTGGVAAGFPQSITTPLGSTLTITGFNAATGVVSYSYTLNDNEAHPTANGANTLPEQFTVTAVDDNGTTATGSLDVNIVDDLPKGVNDSNGTASETLLTLNGNVLTNDVQGADRVTIGEGTGPITPGTFTGTYGTLVLNANGTYTYTLNTSDADFKALHGGGDGTDTFTYTITDADGDSSTANLVLQIHNNDDPVILNGLNVYGGELTVYEKNLSDGSNPNTSALTQSGTFTVTAQDGVTSLTVGGIAVVTAGVAAGFPQSITTPLGSTLTITGFNAATGVVSYSYTLNDNEAHPTANGANTLPEQFTVTAVDDNGTTATGSLDVNIVDDLPKGVNDSNGTASETLLTLNGNVLTNDVQGADRVTVGENAGPITPGTFTGTYGTLVLNANGTYTYTLNTSDADFKALHGGGDGTDTFTYTITDADGDSSTANLVLQIHNNDDPVILNGLNVYGGELTVYEKNLSDGSNPNTSALTQSGTFTVTALDGVTSLTVGGIAVVTAGVAAGFPQSITTPLGSTLTITGFNAATGVVSYSYTLNDNEAHPTANGANTLPEQFTVTAVDDNGTTATGSLDVNIVDDLPKGVNDSNGTASETLLTLNGNVLTNDVQGADRVTIGEGTGPITPGTFTGTYGTLVLNANGTYTYTLNTSDADFKALHGGGDGTDTFTYTITDADGDSSTANLVLQIHNNDDPVILNGLNVYGGELTVYEKNLSDGTDPNTPALTQSGTFTVTALDGLQTLTVGGITVVSGGVTVGFPQTAVTPLGSTLTITGFNAATGVISYSYTLNDNEAHPTANGANSLTENFDVVATDTDGDIANGQINVNIIDDLPTAKADADSVQEGGTVSGNVLDNDIGGADGPAATGAVVGVRAGSDTSTSAIGGLGNQINGAYGYLTLDANGNAVYHSTPNAVSGPGAVDVFTYTVRDSDGDESTTTITIDVYNSCLKAVSDNDVTVYEKALDLSQGGQDLAAGTVVGSDPTNTGETASGTLVGSVTHAVGAITYALVGSNMGTYGQIQLNANGTYTYTLTTPPSTTPNANDGPNVMHETFSYQATDSLGNIVTSTIVVDIVDDMPKALNDSNASTASETVASLSGNVFNNDVIGADKVAIGLNAGPVTPGTFTGTYGTLVLNANGTYTYTLNTSDADFKALHGGGNGTETFTYTLTDADGDISTANLVLNVHNNDDPVTLGGLDVYGGELTVYEKNLSDGTTPNTPALTQSGTFTVTALDGLQTLTVGGITVVSAGVAAGFPQTAVTPLGSTLTITGYNPATGVISYSYTLNDNEAHPTANGANSLTENLDVVATDTDGDIANGQINVNIVDDLPNAKPDTSSVTEGGTVNISVLGNDINGADGPAMVVGVRAGSNTATSAVGGLGNPINGTYGYLTLDANGNAVYHSNPDSVGAAGATDTFTYTVRDSDGDESTTTITIDVANSIIKANPDSDVTVYEKALDLSKDGQDLAAGTVTGSDPGNSGETASGTLVGSVTGASGALTYTLVGSATGTYGQILLNPDGSYTYTLTSAPKTSPNANDGPNSLTESFTYKATDASGNSSTSTIVVNIVDDVPKAVASDRSVAAVEIDSNLLIVLDVSGSMVDPSGVPGLSRLELAKQAISALLDKYDDLGDVKVQLVTFSSSATDRTSVWVDVATAKTLLAGLTANGGTNYDAAVATMQTAFNTSGKLTGAQNVGYFFSDGKPTTGQEIGTADETALKAFLDANNIKNYAIGLGSGVSNANLDPLAYDGISHTNTNAVVVTDLNQLNSVLSGTVVGAPVTGSLLGEGGTFGADGGFIKSIVVDGTTYTYDPKALSGEGSLTPSGGTNHGTFYTVDNTVSIATNNGGTLVINLDTGDYNYTSQKTTTVLITENIGFTISDNDGDLSSSTLTVKVIPNAPPVAVDDHVITNVLSSNIVVPGELLLANDTDPNGDTLNATPTTFNTGWAAKGADFTGTGAISFAGTDNVAANQSLANVRNAFAANTATMTAMLVVSGYLGAANNANGNNEDFITVKLNQGETLNLNHNLGAGHITMEYSLNGGAFVSIADGGTITAGADGTYQIHVTNIVNTSGGNKNGAENYDLTMTVNYAGAHDVTTDYHGTYTANDNHGGSDSANLTISYQDGHTLTGTSGDDVMVAGTGNNIINAGDGNDVLTAGSGNNELHGGAGNDLLFSGLGNDTLDGGTGIDTASYAHATAGGTVDLSLLAAQNTLGAGTDTLTGIENLTGSNFNDTLTGNNSNNVINGGLGNDILNGGGGDDLLIGGLGNNTLSGGAGADTFQWLKDNSGHDVITDFTPGTDKLDLSQLLQGENGTTASLDDYLHFTVTGSGASTVTSIDVSAMAGAAPNQTIDLAGVNLASQYGVTPGAGGVVASGHDTATIINGMLNDHSLKVDTV
ncbi:retention module-containing protein [Pseudomonas laurylsulfatiphila]|uniref:retention module-containing protein n=2 Tax=Pseudomonas TaxID=286 RepID=UPI0021609658|nr:retention module-containing protein [Pseudomonas laurylsulfatiphila]UVM06559.1 retention module-containing protein [Pseudomonas laurylsulfatiphila]